MQGNVALAPGSTFEGRYELVAKLADGDVAAVYKARQLSTGQPIALKILRFAEQGGLRGARFLREMRLCAQLRHPNIVQLVDAGQTADGTLYIAFAFAPGDSLAALLGREGALAQAQARHLMLQVLDALACAHASGVVHRDLKPSNIMVSATGARRNAVVLDFGISAMLGDDRGPPPAGSAPDRLGTPGYGAPEQWRGAAPSPRADLFAWGLVFLECLTGEPVYRGTTAEIFYRLLGPDPVPIPAALARHPLGALIASAVGKEVAARDVTARGLLEALEACDLHERSRDALPIAAPRSRVADGVRGEATVVPLAGRDRELGTLIASWRRARGGSGQTSLVTGEPGIGKSRLARALRDRIADDARGFLALRCSPDTQHSALVPVIDLLELALGLNQEHRPDDKIARLERELAGLGAALPEAMPLFLRLLSLPIAAPYAPLDVSPPRHKALTLQAILSLLFAMAARRPVLLLAEDLHWADPTTMELLAQLVREAPGAAMCVVMTARLELSPSFATAGVQVIPLGRLDRAETASLVGALVRGKPLPLAVIEYVTDRADGVPLFVEELVRMMIDTGLLVERDDRFELTGPLAEAAIPGTLRALLTARLDRLSRARETARLAAALGREFSIAVLSAASPLGPAVVAEDLDQLMRAGLVLRKRRGTEMVGTFRHALVRDAAYDSLASDARRATHAQIAGALEEGFAEVVRTRPDLLAHHHAAADQKRQAVGYGQRAADQGLERSTYAEAIEHASRVIAWTDVLTGAEAVEAELTANGALIQALMATRGWADRQVKDAAERSATLVQQLDPDHAHRVPTLWFLFTYHHVASHRREARELAAQLVAIAERSGEPGLRVAAATLHGLALFVDGRHADARPVFERAVELYDPVRHRDHGARFGLDSLVLARAHVAQLRWLSGESAAAFSVMASAVAWAREIRHVPSIALGLLYECMVHQAAGDRRAVAAKAGEVLALSAKYGLPAYDGYAAILHDWAIGEVQRASAIVTVLSDLGCQLGLAYYRSLVADTHAQRGELDAAIACIDQCLALCRDNDEHFYEPELYRRRAMYEAERNPPVVAAVAAALEQAAELARRQGMPRVEALATRALIQRFGDGRRQARMDELLEHYPGLRAITADLHEGAMR
ncbi:MAG: TOMM system kinase/cyclase fusion protein [Kofleriaceae bacterium]